MLSVGKLALLGALVFSVSAAPHVDALAQSSKEKRQKAKEEPPPPPVIRIPDGVQSKSIELDKIVVRVRGDMPVARIGYGPLCLNKETLNLTGSASVMDDPGYSDRLREELIAANYNVVGSDVKLFQEKDAGKGEFLIGGIIKKIFADLCGPITKFTSERRGTGEVEVEWQVYDTLSRKVIITKTTAGKSKSSSIPRGEEEKVLTTAFADAARMLLTDPALSTAVLGGSASAAAGTADTAALSASNSAQSSAANFISRLPASKARFQDQAITVRGNVVTVFSGKGSGSGFFVSDQFVVTNAHVVQGAPFVKLKLITGREILGEVIEKDDLRDVALIQTEISGMSGLPIRTDEVGIGSQVFAVGSPLGESNEGTVSAGIISSYRTEDGLRYIQSDVNVMPGNSGGPLLDENGNIIGLTVLGKIDPRTGGGTGLNFFIPINDAMAELGLKFR